MTDLTLVIGNKNYSSWSLRPWIWLRMADIPFEEIRVPLFTAQTNESLEPYFSNHKVPVLIDGTFKVWDTLSILEYLAERYPYAPGWPEDMEARATARALSAEMHSSFFALRGALHMNCRRRFAGFPLTAEVRADVARIEALWAHARERFGADGPWLFGQFSIADAMFAPVAFRFDGYDVALGDPAREYVSHFLAQPQMQAWRAAGRAESEVLAEEEVDWPGEDC
ncbi:MAG: glutathione S-transferase family protein [Gammaproteobacteria bacterium]